MSTTDEELFKSARRELFSAVIGDVMDKLGFQHQFLPPAVMPLDRAMVVCGRAMTVLEADCFDEAVEGSHNPISARPFGLMLEALDDLKADEVYICTGASPSYALWGELMTVRAMKCGAAGAVVDGFSRDTRGVLSLGFPTFSHGSYAQDQGPRGKVVDWRVPIELDGVRVLPGDVIYGDRDGVLVVPHAAVAEAFAGAFEKVRAENKVLAALQAGMSTVEAFSTFGVM